MRKTLLKSGNKTQKYTTIKPEPQKKTNNLPPNLQIFKQKSLSGNGYNVYKFALKTSNQ